MLLRVVIGEGVWLADVGFGGFGLLEPIPLVEGASADQVGMSYTLRREGHLWVLAMRDASARMDLYEFTEDPVTMGDIEVANHYTATHPESIFRRTLTIQRTTREDRTILRGDLLVRYRGGRPVEESVDRGRLRSVAREVFGVDLPPDPLVCDLMVASARHD
jgi:N-hydroxyarylamine O-acetyltransferase